MKCIYKVYNHRWDLTWGLVRKSVYDKAWSQVRKKMGEQVSQRVVPIKDALRMSLRNLRQHWG